MAYEWPGNIRELENVMERVLTLCAGSTIRTEHLPESLLRTGERPSPAALARQPSGDPLQLAVVNAEREQLLEALRRTGGNRTRAADLLNIHRATLYFRLRKYGIGLEEVGIRQRRNRSGQTS